MGINLQRILIVSSLNYLIRRFLRNADYFTTQVDLTRTDILYSCRECDRTFSPSLIFVSDKKICPFCFNSQHIEERSLYNENGIDNNNKGYTYDRQSRSNFERRFGSDSEHFD